MLRSQASSSSPESAPVARGDRVRVCFTSLGCAKNLVDSEVMLGALDPHPFALCADPDLADVIVINTCGFLQDAIDESLEHIHEACARKARNGVQAVIVTGCLGQRLEGDLAARAPDVDAILGVQQREALGAVIQRVLDAKARTDGSSPPILDTARRLTTHDPDERRLPLTPRHYAYLKIAEGCNRRCSFCVIPRIRGPMRSKPIAVVEREARALADRGVRELNVISQDTSDYHHDLDGRRRLGELLTRLDAIESLAWLRVFYLHPGTLHDDVLTTMAGSRRIAPYLDLPIQHTSDRLLGRMRRATSRARMLRLIARARELLPAVTLRTTVMVGHPGETEDDVRRLLADLDQIGFDRLGCFVYSAEDGTHADAQDEPVPPPLAEERFHRVMTLQAGIHQRRAARRVGEVTAVLIDGPSEERPRCWEARSAAEAPEADGVIFVPRHAGAVGDLITARITEVDGYDLVAEALDSA